MDIFCHMSLSTEDSPWKRLAAASRREKKMSHMTVGQLTPDLVMTLKMRSTYCRRFSCSKMWVGYLNNAHLDPTLSQGCREHHDHAGEGASQEAGEPWPRKIHFPSQFLKMLLKYKLSSCNNSYGANNGSSGVWGKAKSCAAPPSLTSLIEHRGHSYSLLQVPKGESTVSFL